MSLPYTNPPPSNLTPLPSSQSIGMLSGFEIGYYNGKNFMIERFDDLMELARKVNPKNHNNT